MILGTSVGRAVVVDAVSEVAGVNTMLVGSMTMVVGSQSTVFVNVAVGRMLVTGSPVDVGAAGVVAGGAEDSDETVADVEAFEPDAVSLIVPEVEPEPVGADVGADVSVAGGDTLVELPTEPVSETEA